MLNQVFLLIFFVSVVATLYRIQLGFAVILAVRLLVPGIVRVNLGVTNLSLNSCLIAFLFLALLYKSIFTKEHPYQNSNNTVFFKPFFIFLGVLFVLNMFATVNAFSYRLSSFIQMIYTEFFFCFMGWLILEKKSDIYLVFKVLTPAIAIMTVYGTYCYMTHSNPYITLINAIYQPVKDALSFMEEERAGLEGRVQGTMTHPLIWGGICMLLFVCLFQAKDYLNRYHRTVLLSLLFLNVVFSGSRSALLALLTSLIVIAVFGSFKIKRQFLIYSIVGGVAVVFALYQIPALSRYQELFETTIFFWDEDTSSDIRGSSVSMRLEQLEGSFNMIQDGAFFQGLGQGFIKYYSAAFGVHPILKGFESLVFMAVVESGFLGLILWLAFFFMLYKMVIKLRIYKIIKSDLKIVGLKAFIIAYLLFTVFTGIQSTLYLYLVLYVILLKGAAYGVEANDIKHLELTKSK